jgi:hypothetical protein
LPGEVELTEERERHIEEEHSELLPAHRDKIAEVLAGTLTSGEGGTSS